MRKKHFDLKDKSEKELEKIVVDLTQEIAKLQLESKVNPVKDSNLLGKKRQRLAVAMTLKRIKHSQPKTV